MAWLWAKYKEKENLVMRIDEITNSTEKLELLKLIDAAIWQSFDAESTYGDYDDTQAEQGAATTPAVNQAIAPKPAAVPKSTTPVKKLTPQQLSHIKTLGPKQLIQYIKTNLKAPSTAAPTKAAPARPSINQVSTTNNSSVPNSSFDTINGKDDAAKNKDGETDRQA